MIIRKQFMWLIHLGGNTTLYSVTYVNFDSLSVFGKIFVHLIKKVGLIGSLVHVPNGIVVGLNLSHSVNAKAKCCQSQDEENDLEEK
jgi:hypothetical protein